MPGRRLTVRAVIINGAQEALVLRRSPDDESHPGRVDFPGGGVEDGETYSESMAREIAEEAGISIPEDKLALIYTFTTYDASADINVSRFLYVAHVDTEEVQLSTEHDSYWWAPVAELENMFAATAWKQSLHYAVEHDLFNA
jgi:8-oxo-dGTP pyrophosphatase MutT (NUDIX family)